MGKECAKRACLHYGFHTYPRGWACSHCVGGEILYLLLGTETTGLFIIIISCVKNIKKQWLIDELFLGIIYLVHWVDRCVLHTHVHVQPGIDGTIDISWVFLDSN